MAYQNVGTPRFYVSILQWLKALGKLDVANGDYITSELSLVDINPTSSSIFSGAGGGSYGFEYISRAGNFDSIMPNKKNFFMLLGHTFADVLCWGRKYFTSTYIAQVPVVNLNGSTKADYNGFSIGIGNDAHDIDSEILQILIAYYDVGVDYKLGSLLYGTYYDMPNAPNLSLTMSREYGGTKEFTTYNGGSMSNTMWSKPPKWGDLGAWELGSGSPALSRSGRRTWDLKFSYMDDGDLWGSNQSLSTAVGNTLSASDIALYDGGLVGDLSSNTAFRYNLLTDDNFFSQVWHKTLGMTLPMIFQPDSSNNNPDQFAIVKGVPNSLKATLSAHNVYDISLSIEEVW